MRWENIPPYFTNAIQKKERYLCKWCNITCTNKKKQLPLHSQKQKVP